MWVNLPQPGVASGVCARKRGELDLITGDAGQPARVRAKQADGASHNRIEHRLDVRLRAANDAENVASRRLLVERSGQFTVARLQLGEETNVLDRDHGLVGEGLEERNLLIGERMDFSAVDRQGTYQPGLP